MMFNCTECDCVIISKNNKDAACTNCGATFLIEVKCVVKSKLKPADLEARKNRNR
jgi:hypothetical protein